MELVAVFIGLVLYDVLMGYGMQRWRRNVLGAVMVGLVWHNTDLVWWADILVAVPTMLIAEGASKKARADRT